MKRFGAALFALALAFQAPAAEEYGKDYLQARQQKFRGMRNTGVTMGIIGGVATLAGIVLMANGEWETTTGPNGQTQSQAQDGAAVGGTLLLVAGIPVGITGIILGSIGAKKVGQYQRRIESLELGLELGPRRGLRLSYSF